MKSNIKIIAILFLLASPVHTLFAQSLTPDVSNTKATICESMKENLGYGDTDMSTSGAVTKLQNYLYSAGYYPHSGNGQFGWATYSALVKFQLENNLPGTGYFGPMSRQSVNELSCIDENPIIEFEPIVSVIEATTTELVVLDSSKVLLLPYNEVTGFEEWKPTWGSATTTIDGYLLLSATASTTGAEAILIGSEDWTDYIYTINFIANRNGSFSLIGRFVDNNNFLACTFSRSTLWIQQRIDGVSKNLSVAHVNLAPINSIYISTNVNMKVVGDQVTCSMTGDEDVKATITDSRFLKGGIGLSIWHSVPGVSSLLLREVDVKKI